MEPPEGVCVNCGAPAGALYRRYSPTVLKLTKCKRCGNIADKYLEYDSTIITVDLVLLSKEAYRHVLYNTPFSIYWKLFLILIIVETYEKWTNASTYKTGIENVKPNINTIDINNYLHVFNDTYKFHKNPDDYKKRYTFLWRLNNPKIGFVDLDEPFSVEKGLYATFITCFIASVCFIGLPYLIHTFYPNKYIKKHVDFILMCKGLTLASTARLFLLSHLIWGSDQDFWIHYVVLCYTFPAMVIVHSVMCECSRLKSSFILIMSIFVRAVSSEFLHILFHLVFY